MNILLLIAQRKFLYKIYTWCRYHVPSYLKAKLGPSVDEKIRLQRLEKCFICNYKVTVSNRDYCQGCNCPMTPLWPDSELKRKTNFKYALCPLNKWIE